MVKMIKASARQAGLGGWRLAQKAKAGWPLACHSILASSEVMHLPQSSFTKLAMLRPQDNLCAAHKV